MNNTTQKGNIVTALLIGVVFIGLTSISMWYFYSLPKNPTSPPNIQSSDIPITSVNPQPTESNPSERIQKYTSKNFKISFSIPSELTIKEQNNSIELSGSEGKIIIGLNGTNFTNLPDYLNNYDQLRKGKILSSNEVSIDTRSLTRRKVMYSDSNLVITSYYAYSDYEVLFISTEQEEIVDDLDFLVSTLDFTE